jgi:hypothetical protein
MEKEFSREVREVEKSKELQGIFAFRVVNS